MKVFAPPYRYSYPRFDPRDTIAAKRVQSYYHSSPEGVSVWVTKAGTVTQTQPADADVAIYYRGGYLYLIADSDAAVLTAAGYGVANPPAGVSDTIGATGTPRPGYPVTWNDLASFTWDQASQFLWGSFANHV